jgi:hypothetical protein
MTKKSFSSRVAAVLILIVFTSASNLNAQPRQQEGIKVHGHWTIEVRDPDGRLVERRQFENALVPTGAGVLARALFHFDDGNNFQPGCLNCAFSWRVTLLLGSTTLVIDKAELIKALPNDGTFVLSGSTRTPAGGTITKVITGLVGVDGFISFTEPLTEKLLTPGISVTTGQLIDVKVVISFS